jgi:Protein of unknown function (DUF3313)
MKQLFAVSASLILLLAISGPTVAGEFFSEPEKLKPDEKFAGDLVYYPDDILARLPKYDSVMVDEPVIFLAENSDYKGFKASDLAAISDLLRTSFSKGLASQEVSIGNFKVVDEPGPSVLYLRLALKDLYVKKEKRGLLSYTPIGIVAHGVANLASDAIDKTDLIEMKLEAELQDTQSGEVLFAAILDRGHRKDKKAHVKEEQAGWDAPGSMAETLGRRLACRLDNARLPVDKQVDCVKAVPVEEE